MPINLENAVLDNFLSSIIILTLSIIVICIIFLFIIILNKPYEFIFSLIYLQENSFELIFVVENKQNPIRNISGRFAKVRNFMKRREIVVPYGAIKRIAQETGLSVVCVRHALKGMTNSDNSYLIRKLAKERYRGIEMREV